MLFEEYLPGLFAFVKSYYWIPLVTFGLICVFKLREVLILLVFIAESILYFQGGLKATAFIIGLLLAVIGFRIPVLSNFAIPAAALLAYTAFLSYPYFILKEAVRRYLYEHKHIESFTHEEKIERGYVDEISTIYDIEAEFNVVDESELALKELERKEKVLDMTEENCLEYFDKFKGA